MKGRKHDESRGKSPKGATHFGDDGGSDKTPKAAAAVGSPKVFKEAKAKSSAIAKKGGGSVSGKMSAMNLGRPGRKRGGRVGAELSPLSSAANATAPAGRNVDAMTDGG